MGIYTDLASTDPIPSVARVGLDRSSAQQLLSRAARFDPEIRANLSGVDQVTTFPEQVSSGVGDTYTITMVFGGRLSSISSFTTSAINYNSADNLITLALAVELLSVFPEIVAGDIVVTSSGSAGVSDGSVTFTFANGLGSAPIDVSIQPTGWTEDGTPVETVGQGSMPSVQALMDMNVISGDGLDPSSWVKPPSNGQSRPRYQLIRDLGRMTDKVVGNDEASVKLAELYPTI